MTDDLARLVWMHREGVLRGFTKEYNVKILGWYELHETRESAFARERAMKEWNRAWKIDLIQKMNPEWRDLYDDLLQ